MFHSFFPQPKAFFTSLVVWTLISIAGWYLFAASLGVSLGYAPVPEEQQPIDLSFFLLPENVWFYSYFLLSAVIFCGACRPATIATLLLFCAICINYVHYAMVAVLKC